MRGAVGCSDRGHTAVSQLKAGDIDFDAIFSQSIRWFHCSGIFAALSTTTPGVAIDAMKAAKRNGTVISYDLDYRPSFWKEFGGLAKAQEVNKEIAKYVDVMIGNEEDFTSCLWYTVDGVDENMSDLNPSWFKKMTQQAVTDYSNFQDKCIREWVVPPSGDTGFVDPRPCGRRRQFCVWSHLLLSHRGRSRRT